MLNNFKKVNGKIFRKKVIQINFIMETQQSKFIKHKPQMPTPLQLKQPNQKSYHQHTLSNQSNVCSPKQTSQVLYQPNEKMKRANGSLTNFQSSTPKNPHKLTAAQQPFFNFVNTGITEHDLNSQQPTRSKNKGKVIKSGLGSSLSQAQIQHAYSSNNNGNAQKVNGRGPPSSQAQIISFNKNGSATNFQQRHQVQSAMEQRPHNNGLNSQFLQKPNSSSQQSFHGGIQDTNRKLKSQHFTQELPSPQHRSAKYGQQFHPQENLKGAISAAKVHPDYPPQREQIVGRNLTSVQDNRDQIIGFYNKPEPKKQSLSPNSKLKTFPNQIEGHYQQPKEMILSAHQGLQTKNNFGPLDGKLFNITQSQQQKPGKTKPVQKNSLQVKIHNSNNQSTNIDSFDHISSQFNQALSAKNSNGNNQFSLTSKKTNNEGRGGKVAQGIREASFRGQTLKDRTKDQNSQFTALSSPKNTTQSQLMLSIQSQNNNPRDNSSVRTNSSKRITSKVQSKMFRPHSLKQLMPTIDEQMLKLSELGSLNTIKATNQDSQGTQFLFRTLQSSNKSQQPVSKVPLYPNVQSQFNGQIVNSTRQSKRKHEQHPNQGSPNENFPLTNETQSQSCSGEVVTQRSCSQQDLQAQMQGLLLKTQRVLGKYQQRECMLLTKCSLQQQEIKKLKSKLQRKQSNKQ